MDSQPEHEPITATFRRLEEACAEFAERSIRGDQSIDDALGSIDTESRPTLLKNLIAIEVANSLRGGEVRPVDDYIEQYPEHASEIRTFFETLKTDSTRGGNKTFSGVEPSSTARAPTVSCLGDWRLTRELGRGGMGVVYEAIHASTGERVALKTLPTLDGVLLHRFKREFRSLVEVSHPNLVKLLTLEADGPHWFFTMELIEGTDFLSWVRPSGGLEQERLRSAARQLVGGVSVLHDHGVIHRDLKPSNVLVSHQGNLKILDFGLIFEADRSAASAAGQIVGTAKYMAPEQAAGRPVSESADWYSVGTMLYEALAGVLPFDGSIVQILTQKQVKAAPQLDESDDLASLTMQLLARNENQRPVRAEIASRLGEDLKRNPGKQAVELIGRTHHLAVLQESLEEVSSQFESRVVMVSGRSGEGKSAVVDHFVESVRSRQQVTVLSGRCYDRESVPFKALDGLMDALASHLKQLPENQVGVLLPRDIAVLAHLFPVLQRISVIAEAPRARLHSLDDQQVRSRAFTAFRELLLQLGDRQPVIMFIDNLQWADADSAIAMFEALKPPESPRVLFVGSFRSDETEHSDFLRLWREMPHRFGVQLPTDNVLVAPFSAEQCEQLFTSLTGDSSHEARSKALSIHAQTDGNPFLATELIRFRDSVGRENVSTLTELINEKLSRVHGDAATLLSVVAISGQALGIGEATRAIGRAESTQALAAQLANERLIRVASREDDFLVDTFHDRVREAVIDRMQATERRETHMRLAHEIKRGLGLASHPSNTNTDDEDTPGFRRRVFDIAYHFDGAGDRQNALRYGLRAAEIAKQRFACAVAAEQYAIANRNLAPEAEGLKYRIHSGWGHTLMLLGRYPEAEMWLQSALESASDANSRAAVILHQGELAFKQGQIERSIDIFRNGLLELGKKVPKSRVGLTLGILRGAVGRIRHRLLWFRRNKQRLREQDELALRLLVFLSSLPSIFRSTMLLLCYHTKAMNQYDSLVPSADKAAANAFHGVILSMMGFHKRGYRYGRRAVELAAPYDDLLLEGNCFMYLGIGCYASTRFQEGIEYLEKAIQRFQRSGDHSSLHLARFHLACCQYELGDLRNAAETAIETFRSSERIGDSRLLCSSYLLARLTGGDLPFEAIKCSYPDRPDDVMSTAHGMMAEGLWHLHHERYEAAVDMLAGAASTIRKNFCVNSHTLLVAPYLCRALREHAEQLRGTDKMQSDRQMRRARKAAKWARRLCWLMPAARPLVYRECSLLARAQGKYRKATRLAKRSADVARKIGATLEVAKSERLLSEQQSGGPDDANAVADGFKELERARTIVAEAFAASE